MVDTAARAKTLGKWLGLPDENPAFCEWHDRAMTPTGESGRVVCPACEAAKELTQ